MQGPYPLREARPSRALLPATEISLARREKPSGAREIRPSLAGANGYGVLLHGVSQSADWQKAVQ